MLDKAFAYLAIAIVMLFLSVIVSGMLSIRARGDRGDSCGAWLVCIIGVVVLYLIVREHLSTIAAVLRLF